jgi:hypothetical protein
VTILQARRYQKKDADLDAVAASGLAGSWTTYTPTVTAGSGSFTTVSASGRYLVIGKLTFAVITVTITTVGTATSYVAASLPNTANAIYEFAGRESALTGKMLSGETAGAIVVIRNYDNSSPAASGAVLRVSGFYEVV